MVYEVAPNAERPPALGAFVWFLSCMHPLVPNKSRLPVKAFAAVQAGVRFLPGMGPLMDHEVRFAIRGLPTVQAFVWLFGNLSGLTLQKVEVPVVSLFRLDLTCEDSLLEATFLQGWVSLFAKEDLFGRLPWKSTPRAAYSHLKPWEKIPSGSFQGDSTDTRLLGPFQLKSLLFTLLHLSVAVWEIKKNKIENDDIPYWNDREPLIRK